MNRQIKSILAIIVFIAILGGLKLVYDANVKKGTLEGVAGNITTPGPSVTQPSAATVPPATGASTQPTGSTGERPTVMLPDATVYDAQGNTVKLSSFRGKKTIINAWASWCGPCKAEMPDFAELDREAGDDYQIVMVNIQGGLETRENADRFLKDNNFEFNTMLYDEDMDFAQMLEISSIPTTIFVDEEGQIHIYQQGMLKKSQVLEGLSYLE